MTIDVVYIAGKGRSGSTLLDNILGQFDGWFSTGELTFLWEWGVRRGFLCGCGEPVVACSVWSGVLRDLFEEGVTAGAAAVEADQNAVLRWPRVPALLISARRGTADSDDVRRLSEAYGRAYRAIAARTESGVVVDSSKWPFHPGILGLVEGIRAHVVHLVRDPRAVAHSYTRERIFPDREPPEPMPTFGAVHSSASWLARNVTAELLGSVLPSRPLRVRYEDLVGRPTETLRAIVEHVGVRVDDVGVQVPRTVNLGTTHTVGGNPNRMRTGPTPLRLDDEWRRAMPAANRRLVATLTSPLRWRYGYR